MKNKFTLYIAPAILFCWCLFSLQACKQPLISDNNLLTKGDNLNASKDTLSLKVSTVYEKPLITSGATVGVLGSIYDRNFGTSIAGVYAHCFLTSDYITFGTNPILDSVVFSMGYSGQYGLCTTPMDISVFELNQYLYDSVAYYSNSVFQVKTPPLGTLRHYVPDLIDSIPTQYGPVSPQLRIPLSAAFGKKILLADTSYLATSTSFLNLFKGFYVACSSTTIGNGMVYLDLPSVLSGITLYYHNDTSTTTIPFYLPFAGNAVNHFDNSFTNTPVALAVNSPAGTNSQKVYIEAGAAVKGKILITNLDTLPKNIGINKAELVITQDPSDTTYAAPTSLYLYRIDDAGFPQFLDDQGLSTYGGYLATETVNGVTLNRYRFNFTKYFQKLMQGIYSNNGFYLQDPSSNSSSERVILTNSSTDKKYQITLAVTFTKL